MVELNTVGKQMYKYGNHQFSYFGIPLDQLTTATLSTM